MTRPRPGAGLLPGLLLAALVVACFLFASAFWGAHTVVLDHAGLVAVVPVEVPDV